MDLGGETAIVGASVGIVVAGSDPGSAEDLMREADVAMYRAKAAGKNRRVVRRMGTASVPDSVDRGGALGLALL